MTRFFIRERFGKPQLLAGLLLLVFMTECAWLAAHTAPNLISPDEFTRVQEGLAQWHGHGVAGTPAIPRSALPEWVQGGTYDPDHSPLWYLIGSAPIATFGVSPDSLG